MPSSTTLYRVSHIILDYFLDLTLKCIHNAKKTGVFCVQIFILGLLKIFIFYFLVRPKNRNLKAVKNNSKWFCIYIDHDICLSVSNNHQNQQDYSTLDGTVSTAVFWRHKCQLSFCFRQNYINVFGIKWLSYRKLSAILCVL